MQTYRVEGGKLAQTWLILEPLGPHGPTPRRRSVDQSSTSERALNHCPPRKVHIAMSKVVAIMSMSLDGYIADLNDGVAEVFDWYFTSGDVEIHTGGSDPMAHFC